MQWCARTSWYQLEKANEHISSQLCIQGHYVLSLKSATIRVCRLHIWSSPTNQGSPLPLENQFLNIYQHTTE